MNRDSGLIFKLVVETFETLLQAFYFFLNALLNWSLLFLLGKLEKVIPLAFLFGSVIRD